MDGRLYGTTTAGGAYGEGTVFAVNKSGKERVIHSFGGDPDGAEPRANLVEVKGTLYGTTLLGGAYDVGSSGGTVFSITPKRLGTRLA